ICSDTPRVKIARHWETGESFDWRDYFEIESNAFSPRERVDVVTTLNDLAQLPEFQETLTRSQSPHIREVYEEAAKLALKNVETLESMNKKLGLSDQMVVKHLEPNLQRQKIRIGNLSSVRPGSFADASTRFVSVDFDLLKRASYGSEKYKGDGKGITHNFSLHDVLYHEIKHLSDINVYNKCLMGQRFKAANLSGARFDTGPSGSLAERNKHTTDRSTEQYAIGATNHARSRYFDEEKRVYKEQDSPVDERISSEKNENYMAKVEIETEFPLPILSREEKVHTEITPESFIKMIVHGESKIENEYEVLDSIHEDYKPNLPQPSSSVRAGDIDIPPNKIPAASISVIHSPPSVHHVQGQQSHGIGI
ncbi:MAG: hypothetical protein P8P30_01000, partial [Rickettsiales bacterium]|nr:hypothetical protein [Rickettsiales bacterium]